MRGTGVAHNQLRQTLGEGVPNNQLRQTFGRRLEEHKGIFHQNSSKCLELSTFIYIPIIPLFEVFSTFWHVILDEKRRR